MDWVSEICTGGEGPCVVIATESPMLGDSLYRALHAQRPDAHLLETEDLPALLDLLSLRPVDLLLLDVDMASARGLLWMQQARALHPELRVAVVSVHEEVSWTRRATAAGAVAYLPKSMGLADLSVALKSLLAGRDLLATADCMEAAPPDARHDVLGHRLAQLTPQQVRIACLVGQGLQNKEIAAELGICENTVKVHVSSLLHRLRLQNRTQVAVLVESAQLKPEMLAAVR
jgi:DNA-binding NarL/FixJ family response regulator